MNKKEGESLEQGGKEFRYVPRAAHEFEVVRV